jgi:hypothetical protein
MRGRCGTTTLRLTVDTGTPAATRLKDTDCVLVHAKHAIEIEEIEAQLLVLSGMLGGSKSLARY